VADGTEQGTGYKLMSLHLIKFPRKQTQFHSFSRDEDIVMTT